MRRPISGDFVLTDYLTEQEQIEILKKWIKQYSFVILAGVLIAVAIISGWRFWQNRQLKILSHASSVYDEMLARRSQNDPVATLVQAQKILTHYPQTIYGQMAALMIARDAAVKKDYALAIEKLNWVIAKTKVTPLRQMAKLRVARILITQHQPEKSLQILENVDDNSFVGLIDEVRGDAYFALKNISKAREAYQKALTELPNAEIIRPMLQMKYDNLAPLN